MSSKTTSALLSNQAPQFNSHRELTFQPKFLFHLGIIPESTSSIFYLSICNPYQEISFKGLQINRAFLYSKKDSQKVIVEPTQNIILDELAACSCLTREFAIVEHLKGNYTLEVEYSYSI